MEQQEQSHSDRTTIPTQNSSLYGAFLNNETPKNVRSRRASKASNRKSTAAAPNTDEESDNSSPLFLSLASLPNLSSSSSNASLSGDNTNSLARKPDYSRDALFLSASSLLSSRENLVKETLPVTNIEIGTMLKILRNCDSETQSGILKVQVGDIFQVEGLTMNGNPAFLEGRLVSPQNSNKGYIPLTSVLLEEEGEFLNSQEVTAGTKVRAMYEYEPTKADELYLLEDALITVQESPFGGWWKGTTEAGEIGWFPANLVSIVQGSIGTKLKNVLSVKRKHHDKSNQIEKPKYQKSESNLLSKVKGKIESRPSKQPHNDEFLTDADRQKTVTKSDKMLYKSKNGIDTDNVGDNEKSAILKSVTALNKPKDFKSDILVLDLDRQNTIIKNEQVVSPSNRTDMVDNEEDSVNINDANTDIDNTIIKSEEIVPPLNRVDIRENEVVSIESNDKSVLAGSNRQDTIFKDHKTVSHLSVKSLDSVEKRQLVKKQSTGNLLEEKVCLQLNDNYTVSDADRQETIIKSKKLMTSSNGNELDGLNSGCEILSGKNSSMGNLFAKSKNRDVLRSQQILLNDNEVNDSDGLAGKKMRNLMKSAEMMSKLEIFEKKIAQLEKSNLKTVDNDKISHNTEEHVNHSIISMAPEGDKSGAQIDTIILAENEAIIPKVEMDESFIASTNPHVFPDSEPMKNQEKSEELILVPKPEAFLDIPDKEKRRKRSSSSPAKPILDNLTAISEATNIIEQGATLQKATSDIESKASLGKVSKTSSDSASIFDNSEKKCDSDDIISKKSNESSISSINRKPSSDIPEPGKHSKKSSVSNNSSVTSNYNFESLLAIAKLEGLVTGSNLERWQDRILVDDLEKLDGRDKKRFSALWELIQTERDYVRDLYLTIDVS
jgi:hypothetical protein